MDRKILLTVITLAALLSTTPFMGMACAKPATNVSGTAVVDILSSTTLDVKPAGNSDNTILTISIIEMWQGDIEAVGNGISRWVSHDFPNPGWTLNIHEKLTFNDATVLGKSGSFTMELVFQESETGSSGCWTILRGTGELANLHGHGTLDLSTFPYEYSGQVHFSP
jgi:hypothetical protein